MLLITSRGFMDIYYGTAIDQGPAAQPPPSATEEQIWCCWHISQCSPDRLIKSHWCSPASENGFSFSKDSSTGRKKLRLMAFCALLQFVIVFLRETVYSLALWYMQMWPGRGEMGTHKITLCIDSLSWSGKAYRLKFYSVKKLRRRARGNTDEASFESFLVQICRCISPVWPVGGDHVLTQIVKWS